MPEEQAKWDDERALIYEHWRAGEFAEARILLERNMAKRPACIEVTLGMAHQVAMEDTDGSRKDAVLRLVDRAANQEGSDVPDNMVTQALLRHDAGDRAGTRKLLDRLEDAADDLRPSSLAQLVSLIGSIMLEAGNLAVAEETLRAAFELQPAVPAYSAPLVDFLLGQGRREDAQEVLGRAVDASNPQDAAKLMSLFARISRGE